jgi:uncharacterized protein with HEPN domain
MTSRTLILRLTDIIEAVEHIRSVITGVSLDDFEADWQKRWLVERGVEIISEASRHLDVALGAPSGDSVAEGRGHWECAAT